MVESPRPTFIVIGVMKAATSSLYEWLRVQPDVFLAHPKETDFFSSDERWAEGLGVYERSFSAARPGQVIGEASVSYTSPERAEVSAERMRSVLPDVRLVCLVREPIERLRSHYRHEVQRGRERRPLSEALADPRSSYVRTSCYYEALFPYISRFDRDQLLVERFDDLVIPPHAAWDRTLAHIGLVARPAPGSAHNVTGANAGWTAAFRWMHEHRLFTSLRVDRMPAPIRQLGKKLLMRDDGSSRRRLEASMEAIDPQVMSVVWEDLARLEGWLDRPLWRPRGAAAVEAGSG